MTDFLPAWAVEMRNLFRSGCLSQFILHGNIFDVVPVRVRDRWRLLPLRAFLDEIMFETYDVVLHYDRGQGIRAVKGADDWADWLTSAGLDPVAALQVRESGKALELLDRYLLRALNLAAIQTKAGRPRPKIAVIIDFAEYVVPRGEPIQLYGEFSANVVKVLGWANDPAIQQSNIVTVLLTEGLHDLNLTAVENPHASKLRIPLPDEPAMRQFLDTLVEQKSLQPEAQCEVSMDVLARRLTGLSRIGAQTVLNLAVNNGEKITSAYLSRMKKDMIERDCQGLLEFIESPFTLDNVAGHEPVKAWLREDATLLRKMVLHALPMGYLFAGRIGTGKTFIVQCWAGELGIPCVVFKNFRDRWVGATESNLEQIFGILRALGQVMVFVDEADQATGRRESDSGDSGLSGRIYGMLAKEMSDTRNRGKILWVFATSRPDLLEVDLKRQGRLDVHIPLFAPQTAGEVRALLLAVAKKLKFPLTEAELPEIPAGLLLGGHEVEGSLVRALRRYELTEPRRPLKELLAEVFKEVRPNAYTRKLEYMDLAAVKECTDQRFLPPAFAELTPEQVEDRLGELRKFV